MKKSTLCGGCTSVNVSNGLRKAANAVGKYHPLSPEEQREQFLLLKGGNTKAADAKLKLILSVINAIVGQVAHSCLCTTDQADCFQEVISDLWSKMDSFDPAKGAFLNFVMFHAKNKIHSFMKEDLPAVKPADKLYSLAKKFQKMQNERGMQISADEFAEKYNCPLKLAKRVECFVNGEPGYEVLTDDLNLVSDYSGEDYVGSHIIENGLLNLIERILGHNRAEMFYACANKGKKETFDSLAEEFGFNSGDTLRHQFDYDKKRLLRSARELLSRYHYEVLGFAA